MQAGLSALEDALGAGFEDFKVIINCIGFEFLANTEPINQTVLLILCETENPGGSRPGQLKKL